MENSRIELSEFDAYKARRVEETRNQVALDETNGTSGLQGNAVDKSVEPEVSNTDVGPTIYPKPEVQTELGLSEPPENAISNNENAAWANSITEGLLKEWWVEFAETQTQGIGSFLKTLKPRIENGEVVVTILKIKVEILEKVKFPFNRFIQERSEGKLQRLSYAIGEAEKVERRPYTDKEKLEYMIQKHPEIGDLVRKLSLKIP